MIPVSTDPGTGFGIDFNGNRLLTVRRKESYRNLISSIQFEVADSAVNQHQSGLFINPIST